MLGVDLTDTSLNDDGFARAKADRLGARAVTEGSEVSFGTGEFSPKLADPDALGLADEIPAAFRGSRSASFAEDFNATDAACRASPLTQAFLEAEFARYPVGHYCTRGPNSNTFIGVLARAGGFTGRRPGFLKGFGDSPPPAGTSATSPFTTLLLGCTVLEQCPRPVPPPKPENPTV